MTTGIRPFGQLAAVAFIDAGSGLASTLSRRCCPNGHPFP